ncbi:alpha/beta hydrolase [[Curtobacterium] plantarum]|nr:alpha/beta hydrolase [[Curtobacterium] plantarum]
MKCLPPRKLLLLLSCLFILPPVSQSATDNDAWHKLVDEQVEKHSAPGLRHVPAKIIPVPSGVSPELKKDIEAPYNSPRWYGNHAGTTADWQTMIDRSTAATLKIIPELRKNLGVTVSEEKMGGVPVYEIKPAGYRDSEKVVLYIHGGGFVYNPGITGTPEAIIMAAFTGYRVISVDYRMPPSHPYPAALDDVFSVYKALISQQSPGSVAVFGTSAGGGLVMSLLLKAKNEKVALPAVAGLGTPWMDLTPGGGGDTMNTLEWVDNTLISGRGYIARSALLYADGHSLKDPYISPLFGDFTGLPPVIIISGTRDLFLSQCVLTQRKLREAGNIASLQLWDGMSHAQYDNYQAPESRQVFREVGNFFTTYLR